MKCRKIPTLLLFWSSSRGNGRGQEYGEKGEIRRGDLENKRNRTVLMDLKILCFDRKVDYFM